MPTSLTATGVQFPDNSTQTTALPAPSTSGNVLTSNGTTWTSAAPVPGSGSITATASGSISAGDEVILNSSGQAVRVSATPATTISRSTRSLVGGRAVCYDSRRNRFIAIVGSNPCTVYIGTPTLTPSGSVVCSWAAADTVPGMQSTASNFVIEYHPPTDRVILFFRPSTGDSAYQWGDCGPSGVSWNGTDISTGGANVQIAFSATYSPVTERIILAYQRSGSVTLCALSISMSGSAPTLSTNITVDSTTSNYDFASIAADSSDSKAVVAWSKGTSYNVAILSLSSGSLSKDGDQSMGVTMGRPDVRLVSAGKFLFSYTDSNNYPIVRIGDLSGSTMTYGTAVTVVSTASSFQNSIAVGTNGTFYLQRNQTSQLGTISGSTITMGNTFNTSTNPSPPNATTISKAFNLVGAVGDATSLLQAIPLQTSNLTSLNNLVGFSAASYTNGQTATINTAGSINSSLSGLTPGQAYYAQPDGALTTTNTGIYAGIARSSSSILVKG